MNEETIAKEGTQEPANGAAGEESAQAPRAGRAWLATIAIILAVVLAGGVWIAAKAARSEEKAAEPEAEKAAEAPPNTVTLPPELLASAGIETEGVTQRPGVAKLVVPGVAELNPERTGLATPLVGGRIEKMYRGVGDFVRQGEVIATISSPQAAQMHGKMHEARTHFELAQRNYERVQKPENRVSFMQSKARLDEAEANLKRVKRLIELGAGAGKDLVAAESNYKSARAEYDYQSNINVSREVQEARAELETSRIDMTHIEDEMRSLGIAVHADGIDDHKENSAIVQLRAPMSGMVTERRFNEGAGIEAAQPVFAIADLGTMFIIANVPQNVSGRLGIGTPADIMSTVAGTLRGRVSYIDPKLDEATRTARVRIEVANPGGRIRAGMFTDVALETGGGDGEELVVPTAAVQRSGGRTIVFIPKPGESGSFEVREIETGAETSGYVRVLNDLSLGDTVVVKGSFALKTQLEKGSMEEE